jgi:hypothetical protein
MPNSDSLYVDNGVIFLNPININVYMVVDIMKSLVMQWALESIYRKAQ